MGEGFMYGAGGQKRVPESFIKDLVHPIPPLDQQQAIANFLDEQTARIDGLIAKKERLIDLLDQERFSAIDSLISGEAGPQKRLKFCIAKIEQGWSPQCDNRAADLNEWGVLKVSAVNYGRFRPGENKVLPANEDAPSELKIHEDDVLMSRANTRALLGAVACVPAFSGELLLCDKLYRITPRRDTMLPQYMPLALQTRLSRYQIERDATGASASMQNVGQDTVRNVRVNVPALKRQMELVTASRRIDADIQRVAESVMKVIDKLREYRAALISAAVTGQIDVRNYRKEPEAVLETA
jgi:type I restriction enzyme S subunit